MSMPIIGMTILAKGPAVGAGWAMLGVLASRHDQLIIGTMTDGAVNTVYRNRYQWLIGVLYALKHEKRDDHAENADWVHGYWLLFTRVAGRT
jgi:hypothetical protein